MAEQFSSASSDYNQIEIWASELASAIGQNRFEPREKTVARVRKRFDQVSFIISLCLKYADGALEICKNFVKDKSLSNCLPNEVESADGKRLFTNSLREIFLDAKWSVLRRELTRFVDAKKFVKAKEDELLSLSDVDKEVNEAKEDELLSLSDVDKEVNEAIVSFFNEENKSVEEKADEIVQIAKERGKIIDQRTKKALLHKLRCGRGNVLEEKAVTEFAQATGKDFRREPDMSYRKPITYKDKTWFLVGKVDARDEDTIVEVKNRTKRFMKPKYDIIQLQAYMFICNKQNGILLERLHGENKGTNFNFDESHWNEVIIPAMYKFIKDVEDCSIPPNMANSSPTDTESVEELTNRFKMLLRR